MFYLRLVLADGRVVLDGPYTRYLAELTLHLFARGRIVEGERVVSARIVAP